MHVNHDRLMICILAVAITLIGCRPETSSCCNIELTQIAGAIARFRETQNAMPPSVVYDVDGNSLHSWRVLILPYLEGNRFYSHYDLNEPWDGYSNAQLHGEVKVRTENGLYDLTAVSGKYRCENKQSSTGLFMTNFVAVVETSALRMPYRGVSGRNLGWEVDARTGDDLIVIAIEDQGIHWMEPRDLELQQLSFDLNADGLSFDGPRICGGMLIKASGQVETFDKHAMQRKLYDLWRKKKNEVGSSP